MTGDSMYVTEVSAEVVAVGVALADCCAAELSECGPDCSYVTANWAL